ncbi:MAG: sigma-70 family RNA polymerase sigma factor [Anaerolineaceae bacterium]|nr:sigma-70 family RNA polymerase sigma factor [Anaerolineaceae bacterium]
MITSFPTYAILPLRSNQREKGRMSQTNELLLLQRVQAGDEDALIILHNQFANLVFSVAYRVLNDQMAAEEVTQDTFMRLWNKSYSYDPEKGRFTTWLLTVTRRLAIDVLRLRQRREPKAGMLFMDEDPSLWENILSVEGGSDLRRNLKSALDQLPPEQSELIEMVYFYGMSHNDIAETTGIPLGTVKTRIRLGMQKLRSAWNGDDVKSK